ncbi:helix-turn-helix domain-containing protein [Streptomyces sp. NPDC004838]
MDTQHPSACIPTPSAVPDTDRDDVHGRTRATHREHPAYGVTHANTRHTTRFTVIGNHLAQHAELSLLAIGLAVHIQSLPTGARVDIKTLAARFPEGAARISGALRELEAHGYLRRIRERATGGRIVTRTVSCNQPKPPGRTHEAGPRSAVRADKPTPSHRRETHGTHPTEPPAAAAAAPSPRREPQPLLVPQPGFPTPSLLQAAADLLTGLHHADPRLLFSARDAERLVPGVAAWLERDAGPAAVRHALTANLPPGGLRRPAGLLAHRLTAQLPPPPPFRTPAEGTGRPLPLQNCDRCDRAFRSSAPGACRGCRTTTDRPRHSPQHSYR